MSNYISEKCKPLTKTNTYTIFTVRLPQSSHLCCHPYSLAPLRRVACWVLARKALSQRQLRNHLMMSPPVFHCFSGFSRSFSNVLRGIFDCHSRTSLFTRFSLEFSAQFCPETVIVSFCDLFIDTGHHFSFQ